MHRTVEKRCKLPVLSPCATMKVKIPMSEQRPWKILEHDLEAVAREERWVAECRERVLRAGHALDQAQAAYNKAVDEQTVASTSLAMLLHRSLFFGVGMSCAAP